MNEKNTNLFVDLQSGASTNENNCGYLYHGEAVIIDGRVYPVISVIPIAKKKHIPETAEEKIKYLITGAKN